MITTPPGRQHHAVETVSGKVSGELPATARSRSASRCRHRHLHLVPVRMAVRRRRAVALFHDVSWCSASSR